MQRIAKALILNPNYPPIKTTISKFTSLVDTIRHQETGTMKATHEWISLVEEVLGDAERFKHTCEHKKYVLGSRSYFEELTLVFNKSRSKLPFKNETISSLEPKILCLEARVKETENIYRTIYIGEVILGFVLRLYKDRVNVRSFHEIAKMRFNTIGEVFKGPSLMLSSHYKYLIEELLVDDHEMQLSSWMEVQIQVMKDDVQCNLQAFERFMQNPRFQKAATKILETFATSSTDEYKKDEKKEGKEDNIHKIEEMILDTIIKIAKVRYIFCNALEEDRYCYCVNDLRNGYITFLLREIEKVSRSYNYLMMKLPEDYNMTIGRWLEMNIKPELEKLLDKQV